MEVVIKLKTGGLYELNDIINYIEAQTDEGYVQTITFPPYAVTRADLNLA